MEIIENYPELPWEWYLGVSSNPNLTFEMIEKYHKAKGHDVKVIIIPDMESVNFGRGVGYEINEFVPPKDIGRISATKIRETLKNDE